MKNMYLALLVLLSVIWTPCPSFARDSGADGYRFITKSIERKEVQVKIVTYNTQAKLEAAILTYINKNTKYSAIKSYRVAAFSILESPDFNVCTIHMMDPAISYEPEYVGHEMLHCIYGQWHK